MLHCPLGPSSAQLAMGLWLATREEVVRRGREIYERSLSCELEQLGVLDAQSGDYEVDEDEMRACERLAERHPNPGWRFFMKVGYNAAHGIGARPRRFRASQTIHALR